MEIFEPLLMNSLFFIMDIIIALIFSRIALILPTTALTKRHSMWGSWQLTSLCKLIAFLSVWLNFSCHQLHVVRLTNIRKLAIYLYRNNCVVFSCSY